MGTIRKYDQDEEQWKSFASSHANQIKTSSTKLTDTVRDSEEEEAPTETDVENVLEHMSDSIETLKGNVAWLALHGGGGSGGSGGGGGADTSGSKIVVNSVESGGSVTLNDGESLNIVVQSSNSSLSWNITAESGSIRIGSRTGVTYLSIPSSTLKENGLVRSFSLAVTAYNAASLTNIYWNGTVYFSTVLLSINGSESMKVNVDDIDSADSKIIYNYSAGIVGDYTLHLDVTHASGGKTEAEFPIKINAADDNYQREVLLGAEGAGLTSNDVGSGNEIIATLTSNSNSSMKSGEVRALISVLSDEILISSTLSKERENAVSVGKDKNLLIPFYAFYTAEGGQMLHCKVSISGEQDNGNTKTFDLSNSADSYNFNEEIKFYQSLQTFKVGAILTINIKVWLVGSSEGGSDTKTAIFYSKVGSASFNKLDTPKEQNLLSDFICFGYQAANGNLQWESSNPRYTNTNGDVKTIQQICTFENTNTYSGVIGSDAPPHVRLQNRAYGVLNPWTVSGSSNNSLYSLASNLNGFTINICYKADYHPDDDRTIFQMGDLGEGDILQSGILLKVHSLEIRGQGGSKTITLVDSEIIDLTITYSNGQALIYINGVIEAAAEITDFFTSSSAWCNGAEKIYLGCSYNETNKDKYFDFTDVTIYRLMFYKGSLTDYDILFNYLNNMSFSHYTSEGTPDNTYIGDGLKRNFINYNQTENRAEESWLWNTSTNSYDVSNFISGEGLKDVQSLQNYTLPIPLLFVNVSTSNDWTWENFTAPSSMSGSKLPDIEGATIQYYDGSSSEKNLLSMNDVTVGLQGTSTLSDNIKNLNITFKDNVIFIPKETWMPEQTYTLKADIVDSSHSLNAAVGKFVNEELGYDKNTDGSWFPFSSTALSAFLNSWYHKTFKNATLKHAIEGFPVFVILKTHTTTSQGSTTDTGIHTLGIYQFILGRSSYRNLGYKYIDDIHLSTDPSVKLDPSKISSYPYYSKDYVINDKNVGGYWIEANDNFGFGGVQDDGSNIVADGQEFDYINGQPDYLKDKLYGALFWQNDDTYNDTRLELKVRLPYEGQAEGDLADTPSKVPMFRNLVDQIIKLDAVRKRSSSNASPINKELVGDSLAFEWNKFNYITKVNDKDGTTSYVWKKTNNMNSYASNDDDVAITSYLDVQSAMKYFCIINLFGLLDNLQKNMPIKYYGNPNTNDEDRKATFGVYDCDTGLGADNQANLTVSEDLWISPMVNSSSGYGATDNLSGKNTKILGYANKLWMSIFGQRFTHIVSGNSYTKSVITETWNDLRSTLYTKMQNKIDDTGKPYTNLADYFIDEYFVPQTEGCGELLFNLTYYSKYITKYKDNSGSQKNQIGKLNGRRIMQARHWLKNHIVFLDSVFDWLRSDNETTNTAGDYLGNGSASINASLAVSCMPVKVNAPVILKSTVAGSTTIASFCRSGETNGVYFGDTTETSDPSKTHVVTYGANILSFGGEIELNGSTQNIPLSNAVVGNISGSLSKFTVLDLSSSRKLNPENAVDLNSFLPSDESAVSELREVDLRNTNFNGGSGNLNLQFNLIENGNSTDKTRFQKLQKIDISQSCVTSITLPNVPLSSFACNNSSIARLNLKSQNFLETVDLSNCNKLTSIVIQNCKNFKSLSISETEPNLSTISITGCDKFETFSCINNNSIKEITINCANLKTISISNCPNLAKLNLADSPKIESISIRNCQALDSIILTDIESYPYLTSLVLSYTNVSVIKYGTVVEKNGYLDLRRMTNTNFRPYINNDSGITGIVFRNIKEQPVRLGSLASLGNLERVFGHVVVESTGCFNWDGKFTINGPTLTNTDYGNVMLDNTRVKTLIEQISGVDFRNDTYVNDPSLVKSLAEKNKDKIFKGNGPYVTNIDFNLSSLSDVFSRTSVTAFDIYYILTVINDPERNSRLGNLTPITVTSLSGAFQYIQKNPFSFKNSPSRYMFSFCENITSIDGLFYGQAQSSRIKLEVPTVDDNGNVLINNGLFSPLVKCTNMSLALSGFSYITNRHVFRRKAGDSPYLFTNMYNFTPSNLVTTLDSATEDDFSMTGVANYIMANIGIGSASDEGVANIISQKYGNMDKFFEFLPNLACSEYSMQTTNFFNGIGILNFDSLKDIPSGMTYFLRSFNSNYGIGTLDIGKTTNKIFTDPSKVTGFKCSFRVSNSYTSNGITIQAKFPIYANMFNSFTSLKYVGYNEGNENNNGAATKDSASFNGGGLLKYLTEATFPFKILSNCKSTIRMFSGFFMDCYANSNGSTTLGAILPGTLFDGVSNLTNVSGLFYNAKFTYSLVGNGFASCSNLSNVSFIFGAAPDQENFLTGSIPTKLFYHGQKAKSVSLTGFSGEAVVKSISVSKNNRLYNATRIAITEKSKGSSVTSSSMVVGGVTWMKFNGLSSNNSYDSSFNANISVGSVSGTLRDISSTSFYEFNPTSGVISDVSSKYTAPASEKQAVFIRSTTGEAINADGWNSKVFFTDIENGSVKFWSDSALTSEISLTSVCSTIVVSYNEMNNSITTMEGAFQRNNLDPYVNGAPEKENNPDYCPYTYVVDTVNGTWTSKTANNYKETEIWEFDGDRAHTNRTSIENLDDENDNSAGNLYSYLSSGPTDYQTYNGSAEGGSINFCCAPDLLRYCSGTCNINYLFAYSGHDTCDTNNGQELTVKNTHYGLKGRIPPYLLKPFTGKTISMVGVFKNCKKLSPYRVGLTEYLIPESFFTYCTKITNLSECFQGCVFGQNNNFSVFSSLDGNILQNVSRIFYWSMFHGSTSGRCKISGIFSKFNQLTDIHEAFATGYYSGSSYGYNNIDSYIQFDSVFPTNKYNNASNSLYVSSAFSNVFRGYVDSSHAVHESTKTLVEGSSTHNYAYYSR